MLRKTHQFDLQPARPENARALAQLIDIAGEGIPSWMWQDGLEPGRAPLDIGEVRARRSKGGFSYRNATVAIGPKGVGGMVLSYAITQAPDDDPRDLPAPLAPFAELELLSVGSWYVNALAVFSAFRGLGIGPQLLCAVEEEAARRGFGEVTIQVFEQNHGAVRLYRRMGYLQQARSPVRLHPCQPCYTGDVLLLEKAL